MAATSVTDGFPELLAGLSNAVENNSIEVTSILDLILIQVQNLNNSEKSFEQTAFVDHIEDLLHWESKEVIAKAAKVVSEVAKTDLGREKCSNLRLLKLLRNFLKNKEEDIHVITQVCRALGNICYENDKGRSLLLEEETVPHILHVLERAACVSDEEGRSLRNVAAGFLLNILVTQEKLQQQILKQGVLDILRKFLILDGTDPAGEETTTHVLLVLGLLADAVPLGDALLDEQLCKITVQVLGASTSPEVSEMCLELLHAQAEYETVKEYLANVGLCELLITLLEKHKPLVDDDEARNLMKTACDLIVLVLTGDNSMNALYAEGKGQVFQSMVSWLSSEDEDLQITGVLAMGNFARTDKHCIQMVEAGVSKKLLILVRRNNSPDGDIRLQHALLSALRNLVIPAQNKATVLNDGLIEAVTPMLVVPTFPVVFKLLGTLRMVVDGQANAACELGSHLELVKRLVSWCGTEDHPGVQGEANRLLAWLIKNSRDQKVLQTMLEAEALPCLVAMITAEHAVMQNEALLALTLISAMGLQDTISILVENKIGHNIFHLLKEFGTILTSEVVLNCLSLLEQLTVSDTMRKHLFEYEVHTALKTLISRENISGIHQNIDRVISSLDSG